MEAVEQLVPTVGVAAACQALGVPRSRIYRARRRTPAAPPPTERLKPARALSTQGEALVREVLNSERFQDCAPRQVYATLLDEGSYLWRPSHLRLCWVMALARAETVLGIIYTVKYDAVSVDTG